MSAAISDPFLLSSYDVSKRFAPSQAAGASSKSASNLYVTHHHSRAGQDGHATVAVHGDGVHILDVSDLHLASSYPLGPSTSFASPAVSRISTEDGNSVRRTYVAVDTAPDVTSEDRAKTVWMWSEPLAAESGGRSQKTSVVVPHALSRIYTPENLPDRVILVSPEGDLSLADDDLKILASQSYPHRPSSLRKSFAFEKSSLLPSLSAVLVVSLILMDETTRIHVLSVSKESITVLLDESLSVGSNSIADMSCSAEGYIAIVQRDGTLQCFALESSDKTLSLRQTSTSLRLHRFSFISQGAPTDRTASEISLLSLGASFVLLAGITTAHPPELTFLLWDLQYSVVLAAHTLPIPSSLSHTKEGIQLTLSPASAEQALLILTPKTLRSQSNSRSSVLVVPARAPPASTIALALGRAPATAAWLVPPPAEHTDAGLDAPRRALLATMRSALEQNQPEAADSAFFDWLQREERAAAGAEFGREFVRRVLEAVLQPAKPAGAAYSPRVVQRLLRRGVVRWDMLPGGLFAAFQARKDWKSIDLALGHVIDIPEDALVALLHAAVTAQRQEDPAAMQVDAPALPALLARVVAYPVSPVSLRRALRARLPDTESLVVLLGVLDAWLAQGAALALLPDTPTSAPASEVPPLEKTVEFLRHILDASFLTLLQHAPAHRLLRRAQAHLAPALAALGELEALRGPLEPFVRAGAGAGGAEAQGEWRRRRKDRREVAGAVGVYQVEELVI